MSNTLCNAIKAQLVPSKEKNDTNNEQQHGAPGGTSDGCDGDFGSRAAPPS